MTCLIFLFSINFKFGSDNYIITGDNKKLIEFASVFLNNDMKIHRVLSRNIYLSDTIALNMDAKDIKEVKDYCLANNIDDFQSYEVTEKATISLSNDPLNEITPAQKGLQDLINRLSKPKLKA